MFLFLILDGQVQMQYFNLMLNHKGLTIDSLKSLQNMSNYYHKLYDSEFLFFNNMIKLMNS